MSTPEDQIENPAPSTNDANETPSSYPLLVSRESDGLVVHCSDPRFQEAFARFIREDLGLQKPIPIVVPGGIHDLVSPVRLKAARHLWQQIEFALRIGSGRRLVIINHEDCLWYNRWNALVSSRVSDDLARHLFTAAERLIEKRLSLEIECYIARIRGDQACFERVDAVRAE